VSHEEGDPRSATLAKATKTVNNLVDRERDASTDSLNFRLFRP
jgi:hypothetical protein